MGRTRLERGWQIVAAGLALLVALAQASWAADEGDFYRGKTITIIIPIGPGGAYDAYARLVSRHLGRHIPGNPVIIARNMPGGGGVIASNYVYNVAPQDGTTLTIITSSFANEHLFGNPQIRYDARRFLAIGRLLDTTSVLFFWHTSPIKTLSDMLAKPATLAISSINEIPAYRLTAMNRYLGTQLKPIPGYPSARDYVLAAERGGTGRPLALGIPGHARERRLSGGGSSAQIATCAAQRRGDAAGRLQRLRHFRRRAGQGPGCEQAAVTGRGSQSKQGIRGAPHVPADQAMASHERRDGET